MKRLRNYHGINFYNEAEQVIHLLEKDEEVYPGAVCNVEDQDYLSKSLFI